MKKLMTALFISAALGMPFLAAAEAKGIDLVQAAHLTVEQKLEGTVHNQVVYAQNGLAIWDQIIEKSPLPSTIQRFIWQVMGMRPGA